MRDMYLHHFALQQVPSADCFISVCFRWQNGLALAAPKVRAQVNVKFFDSSGKTRLIVPHEMNERKNFVQINRFKSSIIRYGNIQGVRGAAIGLLTNKGLGKSGPPYRMLTYGSVSRAVYLAYEDQWRMSNLKQTSVWTSNQGSPFCRSCDKHLVIHPCTSFSVFVQSIQRAPPFLQGI